MGSPVVAQSRMGSRFYFTESYASGVGIWQLLQIKPKSCPIRMYLIKTLTKVLLILSLMMGLYRWSVQCRGVETPSFDGWHQSSLVPFPQKRASRMPLLGL